MAKEIYRQDQDHNQAHLYAKDIEAGRMSQTKNTRCMAAPNYIVKVDYRGP